MKKTTSMLVALLATFALALVLPACSNKDASVAVVDKIEKGTPLTEGDYTVLITYLGHFAEKAQPIQNEINNLPGNDPQANEYNSKLEALKKANPYVELFTQQLCRSTEQEVGKDNVELVDKYAGYEWFTSPDWATITTDPEAAGLEMQTPQGGTDTGVVAGAVDELKIER